MFENFLRIEIPFENEELPIFSTNPCSYLRLYDFNNIHNIEAEITG